MANAYINRSSKISETNNNNSEQGGTNLAPLHLGTEKLEVVEAELDELTNREREVHELIRLGKRNKEIAEDLSLSRLTVQNYVHRILRKLRVKSRTEAAIYAIYSTQHTSE